MIMEVSLFQLSSKNLAKEKVYIGGIPLHTLQQNGVMERRNKIVVEMAKCMVHSQNVP